MFIYWILFHLKKQTNKPSKIFPCPFFFTSQNFSFHLPSYYSKEKDSTFILLSTAKMYPTWIQILHPDLIINSIPISWMIFLRGLISSSGMVTVENKGNFSEWNNPVGRLKEPKEWWGVQGLARAEKTWSSKLERGVVSETNKAWSNLIWAVALVEEHRPLPKPLASRKKRRNSLLASTLTLWCPSDISC